MAAAFKLYIGKGLVSADHEGQLLSSDTAKGYGNGIVRATTLAPSVVRWPISQVVKLIGSSSVRT
ncbi:hypothetical protein D3C81_2225730 [compost metagenome]